MGFRFFKRIKLAPGISLNFSKSGASFSVGPRGAKVTVGPRGTRSTLGIPGTGLYYTTTSSNAGRRRNTRESTYMEPGPTPIPKTVEERLTLGFFDKLVTPASEEALVRGLRSFVAGDEVAALDSLKLSLELADSAYMAGFICMKLDKLDDADHYLNLALKNSTELGTYFKKYGISATINVKITEELTAEVGPTEYGICLGLVEVYQQLGKFEQAISRLKRLWILNSSDLVVKLSLVELYMQVKSHDMATCDEVVRLTLAIENESAIHAAVLLYRAKALRELGLNAAARDLLTKTIRGSKKYTEELQNALRYERAATYEALGQKVRARRDLEVLYAQSPSYEDVALRLGLGSSSAL